MTIRAALVLAIVLNVIGFGIVYLAVLIVDALLPSMPGSTALFLLWMSLTVAGFFPIILGWLIFFATYMTSQRGTGGKDSDGEGDDVEDR